VGHFFASTCFYVVFDVFDVFCAFPVSSAFNAGIHVVTPRHVIALRLHSTSSQHVFTGFSRAGPVIATVRPA
jgi:hypothetical protein